MPVDNSEAPGILGGMEPEITSLTARIEALHGAAHVDEVARNHHDRALLRTAVAVGALQRHAPGFVVIPGTDAHVVRARHFRAHLTCLTAAQALGYPTWSTDQRTHIAVAADRGIRPSAVRPTTDVVVHRKTSITPVTVDDLPLVHPAEVVACALTCLSALDAVTITDAALNRRDTTREEVAELLTGRYSVTARRRLAMAEPGCRSPLETRTRLALRSLGLRVEVAPVIEGIGETDLLVEGWLIVESDGYEFHSSNEQFEKDRHRDQRALAAGYVPIRLSAADVAEGDKAIQRTVSRALLGVARSRRLALPNDGGIMRRIERAAM